MLRHFRKFSRKTYRLLRHPKHRKKSRVHDWVATKVFDRALWKPARNTFAGGLALGVLVSMLPPVPVQMLIAAVIAIFVRWNVPAAVAGCWFSNPVTWVPIIAAQKKIGSFLLPDSPDMWHWMNTLRAYAMGAILMGAVLATASYFVCLFVWDIVSWHLERRRKARAAAELAIIDGELRKIGAPASKAE